MIAHVSGKLIQKKPTVAVIDVNGIGYKINISLQTFYGLPVEGADVGLNTYTHVREDTLALYGFTGAGEQALFEKLISVSGVGARLAMGILSGGPYKELISAIVQGDLLKLTSIPGVGKKTAERLTLELKDKFADYVGAIEEAQVGAMGGVGDDAVEALVQLGYKKNDARKVAQDVLAEDGELGLEAALRESLKKLSK